jgi:phosphatidylglycerol---prolipoprotein diacylglyceryl transferase
LHPIAFKIGTFSIYYYGLMTVVAYATILMLLPRLKKYEDLDIETAIDITVFAVAGGVTGARLFYTLINFNTYVHQPLHIINIREGGLSWHGALLGGFIGLAILSKIKKISLGKITDFASVVVTLGLAIGRIGCFLNGCCYGRITTLPWGVEFKGMGLHGLRHPTQIYESLLLVVAFFLLLWWWKRKKFDGEMTMAMFGIYGIIRFFVEIFRENTPDQYLGGHALSLAQYLSILLSVVFALLIFFKRKSVIQEEANKKLQGETLT